MKRPVKESFPEDVKDHVMAVWLDNGIYRHLKFAKPEHSFDQWFELVTWPGTLVINGDMGSWTFSRVDDMFTFFRQDELTINEGYWSEKIQAQSKFEGPARRFSAEAFGKDLLRHLDGYRLSRRKKAAVVRALKEDVLGEETEHDMRRALYEFAHDGFGLHDTSEIDGHEWSRHFLWNLYAIVWGIQQFDASKTQKTEQHFYVIDLRESPDSCICFWRPDDAGYTTHIDKAGKYSHATIMEKSSYYLHDDSLVVACEEVEKHAGHRVHYSSLHDLRKVALKKEAA